MTVGKTVSTTEAPHDQHQKLRAEIDSIKLKSSRLPPGDPARRDLLLMVHIIECIWSKLDNEMIVCRRRSRETANYTEIADQIRERLKIMHREIFWRQLH